MIFDLGELETDDKIIMAMKEMDRLMEEQTRCQERVEEIDHHLASLLELVFTLKNGGPSH